MQSSLLSIYRAMHRKEGCKMHFSELKNQVHQNGVLGTILQPLRPARIERSTSSVNLYDNVKSLFASGTPGIITIPGGLYPFDVASLGKDRSRNESFQIVIRDDSKYGRAFELTSYGLFDGNSHRVLPSEDPFPYFVEFVRGYIATTEPGISS